VLMRSPTLGQRFDPRHNSLSILRLVLAAIVALVHAQAIGWADQPRFRDTQLGDLAVDGFFVLSGFLVTRSATRLSSLRRFGWHRALRILPGFWACLVVVAFVVAPLIAWLQGRPPWIVLSGPESSFGYVTRNAALLIRQWDIADLLPDNDEGAMDGSLWTLFFEAICYVTIGLLVACGALRRRHPSGAAVSGAAPAIQGLAERLRGSRFLPSVLRRHLVLALTALVWAVLVLQSSRIAVVVPEFMDRFLLLFLLGALGHVYAHRIRFPMPAVLAAAATFTAAVVLFEDYRPLGAPAFAYLFLWAMVALPVRVEPTADLSYGMYVYHWPVEQVLHAAGLAAAGRIAFTVVALAVTATVAYGSWKLVESPALRHKNAPWVEQVFRASRPAVRAG
jgi:peptidoglycan/LPS O-acetylase OafA/YrhL